MTDAALTRPGHETGYGSSGYRAYVLSALLVVYIFNFIDRSIFAILTEPMKTSLKLEDWHMGVLGGLAFAIFYTTLGIPIARLAERRSRIGIIVIALSLWSLMTVMCGFAMGFMSLFMFRLMVGVGEAGCTPPAQSVIADYFKPSSRATAASIYALGVPLGGMIAGLAGGPINDYVTGDNVHALLDNWGWTWAVEMIDWKSFEGWRIAFIAVGLPGVVLATIIGMTIKEPPRGYTDPPNASGMPTERSGFVAAFKTLMKKPTYVHVVTGAAIASFAGYGIAQFSTSFLRRTHGLSLTEAALIFSLVIGLMAAIGVFLSGFLADKMSVRHPKALSWMPALGMGLSVPLYWLGYLAPTVPLMLPPLMAAALLHYFYLGPMYAVSTGVADARTRATAVAITLFAVNLIGIGLGPTLIGILSTVLKTMMLGGHDLGLTLEICKDVTGLPDAQAAACNSANARGLQWSIIIFASLYGWAALHYLWAGKTLQRDMITRSA
ncbi:MULTISPECIES: spinster family MFS transporter [Hyphomonas]|uniref:Major facilitator family transporter n=2 Tax=Hyphomonas adhaerens TaxID=81029 RepID=A0A069E301_9PROT|nr:MULTISPECIES: MFS transporter [Hyphomonas]KCZ84262.1 major facilitator family transporter [Hyphomonas adhaerens MHS-3]MBB39063.1 MFS transporter [Hyphomonas sp.]HAE26240.1 MFS transporter [Hyphomonas adhaerens]